MDLNDDARHTENEGIRNCSTFYMGRFKVEIQIIDGILLTLVGGGSVCIVFWALYFSHFGLDITDEGFYLAWFHQPFNFKSFVTQFGYIYHPLYWLVEGDVVLFRQINVLLTYGLGVGLAYALMISLSVVSSKMCWRSLILASGYGTSALLALVIANSWLPTPSYNTLAMQALLLAAIGICLAKADPTRLSLLGWALIGVGGWLAYMAKPSTAAVLALCTAIYLFVSGVVRFRILVALMIWTLLLLVISSYVVDGGPAETIERFSSGIHLLQLLGGGHSLNDALRLDVWPLNQDEHWWLAGLSASLWVWCACISMRYRTFMVLGLMVAIILSGIIFLVIFFSPLLNIRIGGYQHLLIWAIPISAGLYYLTALSLRGRRSMVPSIWLLLTLFILLPYAYAFGTNNNYWRSMGSASIFWVLAGVVLSCAAACKRHVLSVLLVLALATQAFTVLRIHHGLEKPYRQTQPLFISNYLVTASSGRYTVAVEEEYGKYLQTAQLSMERAGFAKNTPMIDLTGQSPGLLIFFGAESVGQPWLLGGYPGSDEFVEKALSQVSCSTLVRAWLLTEPSGPRSISTEVLRTFGANMPDYERMASWQTSRGAGGYKNARTQWIYKPSRSASIAEEECIKLRN